MQVEFLGGPHDGDVREMVNGTIYVDVPIFDPLPAFHQEYDLESFTPRYHHLPVQLFSDGRQMHYVVRWPTPTDPPDPRYCPECGAKACREMRLMDRRAYQVECRYRHRWVADELAVYEAERAYGREAWEPERSWWTAAISQETTTLTREAFDACVESMRTGRGPSLYNPLSESEDVDAPRHSIPPAEQWRRHASDVPVKNIYDKIDDALREYDDETLAAHTTQATRMLERRRARET